MVLATVSRRMTADEPAGGALRVVLVVLAVLLLFPVLMMLFALPMGMMGMAWGGGAVDPWGQVLGFVAMGAWVLVLAGVGYGVYRVATGRSGAGESAGGDPALEELRLAYARGDLSDEEFETRREKLRDGGDG